MQRIITIAVAAVLAAACGDNDEHVPIDAPDPVETDAGVDADVDAMPGSLTACLDRPTDLARPPIGQLPCELVPPGLTINP